MRICVVYDCLFPYTVGGGERWYRDLVSGLAREGHEITYLTRRQWDRGHAPDLGPGVRVRAVSPRMSLYTASGRRRIDEALVFGLGVLWHLLRHGRSYDVVHTSSFPYFSLLAAALVRPLGRYRLGVDWFEVWSRSYWYSYLGGAGGRVGAWVQRRCARVSQQAFCFSALHEARLREEGLRGPVTVLRGLYGGPAQRDGGEAPGVGPAGPGAQPLVVFAGRLIPEKRVTVGVAAVAGAAERVPGLRAVFYGDGPQFEDLHRAIAESGAQELITAPGFSSPEAVQADLRRASCLLLPSEREGYGLVIVEAAAVGTPSVVAPGEDNAAVELIEAGENGYVADDPGAPALARSIVRVCQAGGELRERTARWYARHASELSIAASVRTVVARYGGAQRSTDRAIE